MRFANTRFFVFKTRGKGNCIECPSDTAARESLVAFGVLAILLAFAIINHGSSEVQALDTALLYVQLGNVVQQMNFVWPWPVNILNYPYSALNFDLDFISRDCLQSWTFQDHFFMQWFLVWILFGVQVAVNIMAWVYVRFHAAEEVKAAESTRSLDITSQVDPRWAEVRRWLRQLFRLPRTMEDYNKYTDSQIATFLNFARIVYNSLLVVSLQAFMCISLEDGTSVLIADPSVVCGTTSQKVSRNTFFYFDKAVYLRRFDVFFFPLEKKSRL